MDLIYSNPGYDDEAVQSPHNHIHQSPNMILLIQIDYSSAQFKILRWGLSAYRKSLSDGMTVGSGGSAK